VERGVEPGGVLEEMAEQHEVDAAAAAVGATPAPQRLWLARPPRRV